MKIFDRSQNIAAIDIGTNSFHLIVARTDRTRKTFRIMAKEKEMVRLGSGGMRRLSLRAVERGIKTLKRFKAIADAADARVRAVATSAVREAQNRDTFLRRVWAETGMEIEVISGYDEAVLIYQGALHGFPLFNKKVLLIDIGGGSTEFLVGKRGKIFYADSLKLGTVRLTQKFFKPKKSNVESVKQCIKHITEILAPVIGEIKKYKYDVVVGTAGTINNISRMIRLARKKRAVSKINKASFSRQELFKIVDKIVKAKDTKQRAEIKGLDRGRADIIVAGALIIKQIFKELGIEKMTASKSAMREGIVADSLKKGLIPQQTL